MRVIRWIMEDFEELECYFLCDSGYDMPFMNPAMFRRPKV